MGCHRSFVASVASVVAGLGAALALVLAGAQATADSGFRCESGRLVSLGDHMSEVRSKCGDPAFVAQRVEKRRVKVKVRRWVVDQMEEVVEEREVEVPIDEWTYDMGPSRFIRIVSFENLRVTGVAARGYGQRR
jgi:hypothetical protein